MFLVANSQAPMLKRLSKDFMHDIGVANAQNLGVHLRHPEMEGSSALLRCLCGGQFGTHQTMEDVEMVKSSQGAKSR